MCLPAYLTLKMCLRNTVNCVLFFNIFQTKRAFKNKVNKIILSINACRSSSRPIKTKNYQEKSKIMLSKTGFVPGNVRCACQNMNLRLRNTVKCVIFENVPAKHRESRHFWKSACQRCWYAGLILHPWLQPMIYISNICSSQYW